MLRLGTWNTLRLLLCTHHFHQSHLLQYVFEKYEWKVFVLCVRVCLSVCVRVCILWGSLRLVWSCVSTPAWCCLITPCSEGTLFSHCCQFSRSFSHSCHSSPATHTYTFHSVFECVLTGGAARKQSIAGEGDIFRELMSVTRRGSDRVKSISPGGELLDLSTAVCMRHSEWGLKQWKTAFSVFSFSLYSGKVTKLEPRKADRQKPCRDR